MDTIFAPATAPGRAGVAVIRISGPEAFAAAGRLTGGTVPVGRPVLRRICALDGEHLDTGLVLGFAEGASFTGEATVELQLHGSRAVVSEVMAALSGLDGLRLAEPGEFTRRALMNDRLDLTQVEGIADIVDAETREQRRQAVRALSGAVAERVAGWREDLLAAMALLTASIDFADDDVPAHVMPEVTQRLDRVAASLRRQVAGADVAERIRDGFEVAIVGAPNAGKSTLLNFLAGREAAITSEVAGTTRDVLEVRMDLAGLPVTLLDTAGIRETEDAVEAMGVERARTRAEAADLRVHLLGDDERPLLVPREGDVVVRAKADLAGWSSTAPGVSGRTGEGVPAMLAAITAELARRSAGAGIVTHERHRVAVGDAISALDRARGLTDCAETELVAEEIRAAVAALGSLIGTMDTESVLDAVFSRFCLGK